MRPQKALPVAFLRKATRKAVGFSAGSLAMPSRVSSTSLRPMPAREGQRACTLRMKGAAVEPVKGLRGTQPRLDGMGHYARLGPGDQPKPNNQLMPGA